MRTVRVENGSEVDSIVVGPGISPGDIDPFCRWNTSKIRVIEIMIGL
jgi:hypothetical protein